ncbi:MAG: hypothetical protein HOV79_28745 [Hamadaea sp.]|nr:hypothetical protein [Hamadaea sp.]
MNAATVWRFARRAVRYELGIWRSLARWVLRRPTVPAGAEAFGYARALTPILWTFIILSAIEIPMAHLLLPWESARIAFLAIGVWGLMWMIGLLISVRIYPHYVDDAGLHLRYGFETHIVIPWDQIETAQVRTRSPERSRTVQFDDSGSRTVFSLVIASQTSVDVILRDTLVPPLPSGVRRAAGEIRFHADDPAALVRRLRAELPEPATRS